MKKHSDIAACCLSDKPRPSERVLRSLARFGLTLERTDGQHQPSVGATSSSESSAESGSRSASILHALHSIGESGAIVLITGPSGSGKSTLIRELAELLLTDNRRVEFAEGEILVSDRRTLIDMLPCSIEEALILLARCGLAEARLLGRSPDQLSVGQRWRFALAFALAKAQTGDVVIADEFCSPLDETCAGNLCFGLRRMWDRSRAGSGRALPILICATSHSRVIDALCPDVLVQLDLAGNCRIEAVAEEDMPGADS